MAQPHVLLLTFPGQSHINSSLQFAKRLIRLGVRVTFGAAVSVIRRMKITSPPEGLTYIAAYSDGYDDGLKPDDGINRYILEFNRKGTETVREFIGASIEEGTRFTYIVYGIIMPWVAEVAREFQIPSTLFWNQPASVFVIYYHYFRDYGDTIRKNIDDPSFIFELPGLPALASRDMPSLVHSSNEFDCVLPSLKQHFEILDEEPKPKVLVNTFDALEPEALEAIGKYNLVGIGPLMPSSFLDGNDPSDTTFGGDLFKGTNDYMEWLDSKPKSSVIYVSFGSIFMLTKQQMGEIANGLLGIGRPFLWVIRENGGEKEEEKLSCIQELKKQGMIVPWCSQVEVLSHPSVGCFITHCGWNSTFESIVSGVPMVAFPLLTDQGTNAKLVEDVWKIGVRVTRNEEGSVEGHEIKRCLELVMENGEEIGEEIRKNGKKWKCLAREAAIEDGSSVKNLKAFVHELG